MQTFLEHVKEGLSKSPKKLSSRYFYDEKGDKLFQQIMQLDEYYLPECEMQIIKHQSKQVAQDISVTSDCLEIIELGAGDGTKTRHLLQQFLPYFSTLEYIALDISANILEENKKNVAACLPTLKHRTVAGNYFKTYPAIPPSNNSRLVLFLGANIGNYLTSEAIDFFKFIKATLKPNDFFLVAFDMVKYPKKILAAYNDKKGITKKFNLNLLDRMNRELGANFNVDKFDHFPFYNPLTGIASSQLISLEAQKVSFDGGFESVFDAYEAIHTEVSKKFFWTDIEEIADKADMYICQSYFDEHKEYAFVLFKFEPLISEHYE